MEEMENKEIAQIRFEFTDGNWFVLDQQSMRHLKTETKLEIDFALSKAFEEIEIARQKALEQKGLNDLGIDTSDDVGTKDKLI